MIITQTPYRVSFAGGGTDAAHLADPGLLGAERGGAVSEGAGEGEGAQRQPSHDHGLSSLEQRGSRWSPRSAAAVRVSGERAAGGSISWTKEN